jgi:nicotinamide riboside kinase
MRIAIDGASSSGKTTLLNELRPLLGPKVQCIEEASRFVAPRHGVAGPADWLRLIDEKDRLVEFFADIEDWQSRSEEHPHFVVDSSMLIHYCYRRVFRSINTLDLAKRVSRYDLVLYCEIGPVAQQDDFRTLHGREEFLQIYEGEVKPALADKLVALPWNSARALTALKIIEARWLSHQDGP